MHRLFNIPHGMSWNCQDFWRDHSPPFCLFGDRWSYFQHISGITRVGSIFFGGGAWHGHFSTENADSGLELFDGLALGLPAIFFATRKAWKWIICTSASPAYIENLEGMEMMEARPWTSKQWLVHAKMISSIRSCVTFFLSSVDSVWVDGYALTVKGLRSKRGESSLVMRKALKLNKPHGELLYRLKWLVSLISAQRPRHAQKMCTLVSSPANIQELFFISTRCCLQCSRILGPNIFF